jgi:hypothetical protein
MFALTLALERPLRRTASAWREAKSCRNELHSSLRAGYADAFDEVALSEEKRRRSGKNGDRRRRHEKAPLRRVKPSEFREPQRERVFPLVVQIDRRIEEIVPGGEA